MSVLNPVWTKQMSISSESLDPLGLDKVSDRITSDMLTGIVALTKRARYYSFYVWVIKNVAEKEKIERIKDFQLAFSDRERAYAMACIAHKELVHPNGDHSSIQGFRKSNPKWQNSGSDVNLKGFQHLKNDLGGYGYYYQASIFNLGLTKQDPKHETLTPLGKRLANAFEANISKTKYFASYVGKDIIPKSVFSDYGSHCCLCLLPRNRLERDILREIIFGTNEEAKLHTFHKNRRDSLALLMHIIDSIGKNYRIIDDQTFLDIAYFKQHLKDGRAADYVCPSILEKALDRWKHFRAHDYFSLSCESFLLGFLKQLSMNKKDGLSFEQFIALINTDHLIDELNKLLDAKFRAEKPSELPLNEISNHLTRKIISNQSEWGTKTSYEFDLRCNLSARTNESTLTKELFKGSQEGNLGFERLIALTSITLLLIYLRFYWRTTSSNDSWRWLIVQSKDTTRESTDIGVALFIRDLTMRMGSHFSLKDFISWLYQDYIITQATTINNQKEQSSSIYNRPRTWFHMDASVYRIDRDYSPRLRNSRFSTCTSILNDLGLTTTLNGIHELTLDGKSWLEKILT